MMRLFLILGAIWGSTAVMAGAFGSHALKAKLDEHALSIFETGVRYQMYHALALLMVALLLTQLEAGQVWLTTAGSAFTLGIVLFSGSLYALSLSGIRGFGPITPLGGLAFLVGWVSVAIAAFQSP